MCATKGIDIIRESTENGVPYVTIENVREFDVAKTFDCGQCFRFEPVTTTRHDAEFAGVAFGRFISAAKSGDTLFVYNCTRELFDKKIRHFLGLDMDYEKIRREIIENSASMYLKDAAETAKGIRILNQDRWEALCSFIISQNNNIPRIKKLIEVLSERCGEKVSSAGMEKHGGNGNFYAFPTPQAVYDLGESALRELKFGFRASYIADATKKITSGEIDLDVAASLDYEECVEYLSQIKGVGLKVASCTALFGMEKYSAFPVDVWIRRVLERRFEPGFDHKALGEYAGIAQQYLFYHARFENNI